MSQNIILMTLSTCTTGLVQLEPLGWTTQCQELEGPYRSFSHCCQVVLCQALKFLGGSSRAAQEGKAKQVGGTDSMASLQHRSSFIRLSSNYWLDTYVLPKIWQYYRYKN